MTWFEIKDASGYEVSDRGEVRNSKTRRVLKPYLDRPGGNQKVFIGGKHRYISRLVADNFFACGVKDDEIIVHRDGNRSNNCAKNLKVEKKIPRRSVENG